jgi:hypothetical protein
MIGKFQLPMARKAPGRSAHHVKAGWRHHGAEARDEVERERPHVVGCDLAPRELELPVQVFRPLDAD